MLRVMLVDDEPFILQGLKILVDWNKEGFDIVYTASNGKEALEYLKNNEVDLIISDIQMPVMNGLELLENIQKTGVSHAIYLKAGSEKGYSCSFTKCIQTRKGQQGKGRRQSQNGRCISCQKRYCAHKRQVR